MKKRRSRNGVLPAAIAYILLLLGGTLASSLVAYAFARLRAPGREPLFILVLATIMLPAQVTMIPLCRGRR